MDEDKKIFNLLEENKNSGGKTLPVEKDQIVKDLLEIPHEVSEEYAVAFGSYIEEQVILRAIVSSSHRPHLVRHLIDSLNETQLIRLRTIVTHLKSDTFEQKIKEIIDAALGFCTPTPENKKKADELISMVKSSNLNIRKLAEDIADFTRLMRSFCYLLALCGMGDEIENNLRERLAMLPEPDLNWLLKIGICELHVG